MKKIELLAPAGDKEKLKTALHFGADAVYLAGKNYGLRAFSGNFDIEEIEECVKFAHSMGKKVYVTVNIFAYDDDFDGLRQYLPQLEAINVDAIIVSDIGLITLAREVTPNLEIHLSTQASITNSRAVNFYKDLGVSRVVLARECSLKQISQIISNTSCEIEAFVHGAMCISYSGRCLLSNYYANRASNRGECVQACRWNYLAKPLEICPSDKPEQTLEMFEDERGTYLLNSKDLNMISHIDKLIQSKIASLKIEGRMKSAYYVGTVVNAYRRAIDNYYANHFEVDKRLCQDLDKASHREYTTGFYFEQSNSQNYASSRAIGESQFVAVVKDYSNGKVKVEMRNKFVKGERLEILSNNDSFNQSFVVDNIIDSSGTTVEEAKIVQAIYTLDCPYPLSQYDILRKTQ
ncbi:MAG: U32 family peptidase [Clostridia bacterium]